MREASQIPKNTPTTVLLYPQDEANRPANNIERPKPIEREVKRLPAAPWVRERVSSMRGRTGAKASRAVKLRNQRHQKTKRGRNRIYFTRRRPGRPLDGLSVFSFFLFSTFSLKSAFFMLTALIMQ